MKLDDRRVAYVKRRVLERMADVQSEVGKGLILGMFGAIVLGKISSSLLDVLVTISALSLGSMLIAISIINTRTVAFLAFEEKE